MASEQTVGTLAAQAIKTYLQKAESYERSVIKDRDPEDLHQMRVNFRKLRTVMQVFAPGIALPKAGREPQVGAIAKRLGQLRDLDVIAATLRDQYVPDLPDPERETLAIIFTYLAKQRKKTHKKTKSTLKGDRYEALKSSLYQWVSEPDCNLTGRLAVKTVLPDLTLPLVSALWLHPAWLVGVKSAEGKRVPETTLSPEAVETVVTDHSDALHSLRKQVKRVRYQLKAVAEFYGDRLDADLDRLTALQEALGTLQDSLIMENFLLQALPTWETQLPTLKALLADHRYRAWKQWQTLQQHYLQVHNRAAVRTILMQLGEAADIDSSPAQPVKAATSKSARRRARAHQPTPAASPPAESQSTDESDGSVNR